MAAVPTYRELAQRTLGQAASELNAIPAGQVNAAEVQARAAQAQAIATVAAAQALLEIGDILREHLRRGDA
ncbi:MULTISPECIES: hypothetical protein [Streptomyces]|uniref:hypothetical protein n=1 Tax=Streptomyces TaxID=1883 RepID=UPI000F78BBCB|nr:hypothetical protein [Streptomyces sp. WAC05858]RSS45443.1 hypothetical protein EF902_14115 [Streptomyces sp. WAC05858]